MDESNLRRVFDQIAPSQEQKTAMLDRLLNEERKENPMKNIKKIPTVLVAASLLLLACAFAVMIEVDQRLLDYFNAGPEDTELLSPAAVPLDIRMEDSGCVLEIKQALVDRYSALFLMEFTAPEGTVLDSSYYRLDQHSGHDKEVVTPDGTWIGGWFSDFTLLEDEDPRDNHISLLYSLQPAAGEPGLLGSTVSFHFDELCDGNDPTDVALEGDWTCTFTLPTQDSGIWYAVDWPVALGEYETNLKTFYLSPLSLVYELGDGRDSLKEISSAVMDTDQWDDLLILTKANGQTIRTQDRGYHLSFPTEVFPREDSRFYYRIGQIIDPEEIVSITLLGQSFDLDELDPVSEAEIQYSAPSSKGIVLVPQSHTYSNGWTVELEQMVVDRYSLSVLVNLTAPEGTVLDGEDYSIWFDSELKPETNDKNGVGSFVSGSRFLPDDDPTDRKLSFWWYRGPTSYLEAPTQELIGKEISLQPLWLWEKGSGNKVADFSEETYTYFAALPAQDSGSNAQVNFPLAVGDVQMTLTDLYLSPASFAFTLAAEGSAAHALASPALKDIEKTIFLHLEDGTAISVGRPVSQAYHPDQGIGEFVFQFDQIIDPDEVVSLTILGQTFS